jgi:proline dehydrogenase
MSRLVQAAQDLVTATDKAPTDVQYPECAQSALAGHEGSARCRHLRLQSPARSGVRYPVALFL